VQQAYSGGYEHPIEVGGAVFTPLVLSPYGGWHGGCGNEQWTSRTTHTGDDAPFLSYDGAVRAPGSDVGELVPQEVYPRGGGDCDGDI
jgi:hypothetical protein